MNARTSFLVVCIITFFCYGCSKNTNHGNGIDREAGGWNPKTAVLDDSLGQNLIMDSFVHDMKTFYENIHDKKWSETYKQCNQNFRNNKSQKDYMSEVSHIGRWELIDYEVLPPLKMYNSKKVYTVCKFIEGPGKHLSYACIIWTLEDGMWRCDCAGPVGPMGCTMFERLENP